MKKNLAMFVVIAFALTGCASFYNERVVLAPQLPPAASKHLAGRTAKVEVYGGRCEETGELFRAMSGFVGELGLTKTESAAADYLIRN